MSYHIRAKLPLYIFRGFRSRIATKDVNTTPISRFYSTSHSTLASIKSKFSCLFSPSSSSRSWHKPILQLRTIAKRAQQSPLFSRCTNRYDHHGEVPKRSEQFRTMWHKTCAWVREDRRRLWAVRFLAYGVPIIWSMSETIPYSKRTHFLIGRRSWEKFVGDGLFWFTSVEKMIGPRVADGDLRSMRVRRIGDEIIQGLMRGISSREENQKKGIRRWWQGSRVTTTSDLDFFKWEFIVVDDPECNAECFPGGKVVVNTGLFTQFTSDEEIAATLAHEVAHAVARHSAEAFTKVFLILIPLLVFHLFTCFSNAVAAHAHIFDGLINLLFTLPLSRRMELEADYIGLLLLASAGYDPRIAIDVEYRFSKLLGESPHQKNYYCTHPTEICRAQKMAQPHVMGEALSIYREVQAEREAKPASGPAFV